MRACCARAILNPTRRLLGVVDRLVRQGIVQREMMSDRRVVLNVLTHAGAELMERSWRSDDGTQSDVRRIVCRGQTVIAQSLKRLDEVPTRVIQAQRGLLSSYTIRDGGSLPPAAGFSERTAGSATDSDNDTICAVGLLTRWQPADDADGTGGLPHRLNQYKDDDEMGWHPPVWTMVIRRSLFSGVPGSGGGIADVDTPRTIHAGPFSSPHSPWRPHHDAATRSRLASPMCAADAIARAYTRIVPSDALHLCAGLYRFPASPHASIASVIGSRHILHPCIP